jgi:CRISPR-associated protein Cas2
MSLTLIVTRDVAARYRGFLASVMPELAPGVYVSPDITRGVRDRVWAVAEAWWNDAPGGSIVMAYPEKSAPGRLEVRVLGLPPVELAEIDGIRLVVQRVDGANGSA